MAWNALREKGALRVEKEVGTRSAIHVITSAILINHIRSHACSS